MAKRVYTQENLDTFLKENIAMDFIDSIADPISEFADVDMFQGLADQNNSDLNYINSDSIY
jgi:hypothetical protein